MTELEKKYRTGFVGLTKAYARSVNVLIGTVSESDRQLFLNPILEDEEFTLTEPVRFEKLMREIGIFKSAAQAAGEGFKGDIPKGYSDYLIGRKRPVYLSILNLTS